MTSTSAPSRSAHLRQILEASLLKRAQMEQSRITSKDNSNFLRALLENCTMLQDEPSSIYMTVGDRYNDRYDDSDSDSDISDDVYDDMPPLEDDCVRAIPMSKIKKPEANLSVPMRPSANIVISPNVQPAQSCTQTCMGTVPIVPIMSSPAIGVVNQCNINLPTDLELVKMLKENGINEVKERYALICIQGIYDDEIVELLSIGTKEECRNVLDLPLGMKFDDYLKVGKCTYMIVTVPKKPIKIKITPYAIGIALNKDKVPFCTETFYDPETLEVFTKRHTDVRVIYL